MNLGDRFKAVVQALIEEMLPNRLFYASVEYTLARASDGTFDADPLPGSVYPPITQAPIRCLASANAGSELAPGASVLVGWIEGDRTRPYLVDVLEDALHLRISGVASVAIETQQATITAATVGINATDVSFNGGAQPVARVGDLVLGIFPITSGNPTVKA